MNLRSRPELAGDNGVFFGKYRGKVIDNIDPMFQGRIMAEVPSVSLLPTSWAMPCVPYAGPGVGFYAIPPIGANVWIEFENGDRNKPIWVGCFWGPEDILMVPEPPPPEIKVFKTEFITMILNDLPEVGGFSLECLTPAVDVPLTMLFNSEGITILCPEATITMTPESIELAVPESLISMTAESIELTTPPTSATITAESLDITSPAVNAAAEGEISLEAGADISIEAGGAAEVTAGADVSLTGGGDVSVTGGAAVEVTGGADVAITAGAAVEITAGADIALTAAAATEITSVGIAVTGLVEVSGDLLIDGQQPLVI